MRTADPRERFRRVILAAALLTVVFATRPAPAVEASGQVWLLSTRSAPLCGDLEAASAAIPYWRLGPDGTWLNADAAAFHRGDDQAVPTIVFIHGNRIDSDTAVEYGCGLYRHIQEAACGRPFRLLIWSWPSERIVRRNRRDAQLKAEWSDVQSYYLARFLGSIRPEAPVSLIGYSFGARVATGALQLLAGGQIACRSLPPAVVAERMAGGRRPYRLVLIAAAADADWLLPGCRDGLVLPSVDRVLATANGCDPVLRWYPRLYGRGGPQAMGYVGPLCSAQPGSCDKIEVIDLSCSVGRIHDWHTYETAPELAERLGWYTFLEPAAAQSTTTQPRKRP